MLNQIEAFQPLNGASRERYVEDLIFRFEANDTTSTEKKRAILMILCGPYAYVMIRSLLTCRPLNEVTFKEIASKIKEHLNPEIITEYVAALRNLSENCKFAKTLDDMLRDRFFGGIGDEAIQGRLPAEPNLSFDLAPKIAIAAETGHKYTEKIRAPKNEFALIQQQARNNNSAHRTKQTMDLVPAMNGGGCYRCNGDYHASRCKFINEECHFCEKIGHVERACFTKLREENNTSRKTSRT
ncbi:hypothetical protein T4D_4414 [Trichinella pseudospiralis]|uniref:CCHC-type domain-containing protein n=1 Tax=Trichinella pseudospiralis TaxID=6337 RepID=A0A0V1F6H1_TRIPS|nr:hypothetical protein T4D_4414 [Trichinella pseudospiralis]